MWYKIHKPFVTLRGVGHELLSFSFHYVHKNLSTRDPTSAVFISRLGNENMPAFFDSPAQVKQFTYLESQLFSKTKAPRLALLLRKYAVTLCSANWNQLRTSLNNLVLNI
jgi:hypothetical protein